MRSVLENILTLFQLQSSHVEEGLDLREEAMIWEGEDVQEVIGVRIQITGTFCCCRSV